ncbi:MAG: MATE family efflux transporter [Clostridia bacterium]|nr:MATE family efflux transporter [Clostridia bacterium]
MAESQIRMTEGSISKSIIKFAVPLFLGNLFQQLYNTADSLIVSNKIGAVALGAVSATSMLIFLLIGFFQGLSLGAGVLISQFFGAGDVRNMRRAIHTSLLFSVFAGVVLSVAGVFLSPLLLKWMGTPESLFSGALEYIQVYFMGALSMVMYNACMSIMQALGDSKHPLYYLIISSITNVVLDLFFIVVCGFGVWSAALATVISQFLSVFLCLVRLMRAKDDSRVSIKELKFDFRMLMMIMRFGLPSAVQNSIIAFANVVVQSNINYFGDMAVAGCGAYSKIEGFAFLPITSFTAAISTFVGQNVGARNYDRARKGARFGIGVSMALAEVIGVLFFLTAPLLIMAFTRDTDAIGFGVDKARVCSLFYCLLAASHCFSAVLRGAGKAMVPMITMLSFWCVVRVGFLWVMVPLTENIAVVNWVYPLTWSLSTIALLIYYLNANWLGDKKKPLCDKGYISS